MQSSKDYPEHLSRFTLYESKTGFYIIGQSVCGRKFRVLHLNPEQDKTIKQRNFEVEELDKTFNNQEIDNWILEQKQKAKEDDDDEFRQKGPSAWGLLGLIRFTRCYYLCMITKCSVVAMLGHHSVYHIDETKLIPLVHSSKYEIPDRRSAEARLASTFHSLDLAKTFYFSPTYDLTNTLQANLSAVPSAAASMFVWNSHLLGPMDPQTGAARMTAELCKSWFLQIIHGFIDQARISVFGNSVYITIIARRSHQFAGARFFKRGVNKQGYPANEVETEQIVSNQLDSHFSDRYTSYVQHRGSICVSWSQMSNNMSPQPPIRIDAVDPYYEAAAKHFDRMFSRYGYPIRVLNLVKTREKRPRESVLSHEFESCIRYLNQFLPQQRDKITSDISTRNKGLKPFNLKEQTNLKSSSSHSGLSLKGGVIEYTHWDMSRAAKSQSSEVMDYLGKYAKMTLMATSIFQVGKSIQHGVCRTNCIDCLDRTNAAQSVIAKYALGYQLHALGIIDRPRVDYDTDVIDLLTEMYHDHGDTLALQYGGSNLVNTVETYRRINQWSSHSRDLIESIRRFYSNSFMDAQRQDAINVFLGNYQYTEGTNLWDLSTDYYLHNSLVDEVKRSYRQWYEPRNLSPPPKPSQIPQDQLMRPVLSEDWYNFTSLSQLFMSKINSTDKYSKQLSPFEVHAQPSKRLRDPKVVPDKSQPHKEAPISELPLIDELELLYSRYLSLGASSSVYSDDGTIISPSEEQEYSKCFEPPQEPLDEYKWPETEWNDIPSDRSTYELYSSHAMISTV